MWPRNSVKNSETCKYWTVVVGTRHQGSEILSDWCLRLLPLGCTSNRTQIFFFFYKNIKNCPCPCLVLRFLGDQPTMSKNPYTLFGPHLFGKVGAPLLTVLIDPEPPPPLDVTLPSRHRTSTSRHVAYPYFSVNF